MSKGVFAFIFAAILCFLSFGCASTQLNSNTMDLASTSDSLLTEQVLHNISNFIDSEAAVPAQIIVAQGTTSTSNSVTPTITDPLNHATSLTSAVTQAVSTTTTRTAQRSIASGTLSVNASNIAQQNYIFAPVTDSDDLRRLKALYRFAIDGDPNALFDNYALRTTTVTSGGQNTEQYDVRYLRQPGCVLCLKGPMSDLTVKSDPVKFAKDNLCINQRLMPAGNKSCAAHKGERNAPPLIKYKSLSGSKISGVPPKPDDVLLGRYGSYELYVDKNDAGRFAEFALFIAGASTRPATLSGGGAGRGPTTLFTTFGEPLVIQ